MAVTTSTSVTSTVYAKIIETLIIAYQYDEVTCAPFFRFKSMVNQPSAVASFPRYAKDTYPSVATETTSLTPTTFAPTSADVTVARYGIAREITETAMEDSIIGRALYTQGFVMDAARLFGEQLDTDCTALFSSITAVQGSTGTSLTLATMVGAMSTQRANKARGAQVYHLHDNGLKQLQQAQIASTATPWATFFSPDTNNNQFGGYFMNSPVWSSSKNPTSGADKVGAVWTQGPSAEEYCAFALAMKRMPSSLTQTDILQDASIWASFARYGVGIVANNFSTRIVHVNA